MQRSSDKKLAAPRRGAKGAEDNHGRRYLPPTYLLTMSATDLEYIGDASAQLVRAVRGFLGFANELADRHPRRFLAVRSDFLS